MLCWGVVPVTEARVASRDAPLTSATCACQQTTIKHQELRVNQACTLSGCQGCERGMLSPRVRQDLT